MVQFLKETVHKVTHEGDKGLLRWLDPYLAGWELESIDRELINRITDAKLATECSHATVNRTLAVVRTILRRAHLHWERTDRLVAVRFLKEPMRRVRFLTREEATQLLSELPEHLRDAGMSTLATGLRAANVMGLTWQEVDLTRRQAWVHSDQAKARKAVPVPFNAAAKEVVTRQIGRHPVCVFTYQGQPVRQLATKAWYKALKRAGIQDFRWRDLRHT